MLLIICTKKSFFCKFPLPYSLKHKEKLAAKFKYVLYTYTHEIYLIAYNSSFMTLYKCLIFRSKILNSCMLVAERPPVVGRIMSLKRSTRPHPWNCEYVRLRGKGELRL